MEKNTENFVGRINELRRLARFLDEKSGGAVLVAGDRGTGKTTLVKKAIAESVQNDTSIKSRLTRHTRSKQVIVNIPLIIADGITGTEAASYYRSMLIRSITRALEADLLTRKYNWLDLPQRWYRSIGYIQSVKRLVPFAKYTSLKRNTGRRLSFARTPLNGTLDVATEAELEISDTVLEMNLRNLFSTHSHNHQFVIVIDELDKLTVGNTQNQVNVENIALLLKNLFNETGIHAFFIADEPSLGRINSKIKREPFCEESTLFKDRLLVNQMPPADFERLVQKHVQGADNMTRRKHIASLSLLTRMMPSEYAKFGLLHSGDIDSLVDAQKVQLGSYDYSYRTTMQVFINHVYRGYFGKHGQYFDRVLYKSLTTAGNVLLDMQSKYFLVNNYISLLYTTELFNDDTDERNSKNTTDLSTASIKSSSELLTQIEDLNSDEKHSITFAIGSLISLLDRGGWLILERVDDRLLSFQFMGDAFHIENLPDEITSTLKTTTDELKLLDRANKINKLYTFIIGDNLWKPLHEKPASEVEGNLVEFNEVGNEFEHLLSINWTELTNVIESSPDVMTGSLMTQLQRHLVRNTPITQPKTCELEIRINSKLICVYLYFGQPLKIRADADKTFIVYAEEPLARVGTSPKVKQLRVDDSVAVKDLANRISSVS
jgi:AAA+ ATPase superfamily predicted ATPase